MFLIILRRGCTQDAIVLLFDAGHGREGCETACMHYLILTVRDQDRVDTDNSLVPVSIATFDMST